MNLPTCVAALAVAVLMYFPARYLWRTRGQGCTGCSGCGSCNRCGHCSHTTAK
ncbi:MAG: hypothetical protein J6E31_01745 [Pyramidobacter sp.]|nr:hypothetical protein [Pyramidobacter sp.]